MLSDDESANKCWDAYEYLETKRVSHQGLLVCVCVELGPLACNNCIGPAAGDRVQAAWLQVTAPCVHSWPGGPALRRSRIARIP